MHKRPGTTVTTPACSRQLTDPLGFGHVLVHCEPISLGDVQHHVCNESIPREFGNFHNPTIQGTKD